VTSQVEFGVICFQSTSSEHCWRPCSDSSHVTAPYKLSSLLLLFLYPELSIEMRHDSAPYYEYTIDTSHFSLLCAEFVMTVLPLRASVFCLTHSSKPRALIMDPLYSGSLDTQCRLAG